MKNGLGIPVANQVALVCLDSSQLRVGARMHLPATARAWL